MDTGFTQAKEPKTLKKPDCCSSPTRSIPASLLCVTLSGGGFPPCSTTLPSGRGHASGQQESKPCIVTYCYVKTTVTRLETVFPKKLGFSNSLLQELNIDYTDYQLQYNPNYFNFTSSQYSYINFLAPLAFYSSSFPLTVALPCLKQTSCLRPSGLLQLRSLLSRYSSTFLKLCMSLSWRGICSQLYLLWHQFNQEKTPITLLNKKITTEKPKNIN